MFHGLTLNVLGGGFGTCTFVPMLTVLLALVELTRYASV